MSNWGFYGSSVSLCRLPVLRQEANPCRLDPIPQGHSGSGFAPAAASGDLRLLKKKYNRMVKQFSRLME